MNTTPQHNPPFAQVPPQPHLQYETLGYTPYPYASHPPLPTIGQRLAKAAETGLIGRVLAGIGVAITLSGIVMLLVLAAQAGLLKPEVRVAGGGIFAAALVTFGLWLGQKKPATRPGAVAIVATGIAGLLFDVLAMSTIYHWLPAAPALAIAGVVAAVGLIVAHLWDSQPLGLMVSVPLLLLAPFVTGGVTATLVGFAIVYAGVTTWMLVGRNWTAMYAVNSLAIALPAAAFADHAANQWLAVALAATGLAVTLGSALLLIRNASVPELVALVSAAAALPIMYAASTIGVIGAAVLAAVTAVYAILVFVTSETIRLELRIIWLATAAFTSLVAVAILSNVDYQPSAILITSALLALTARAADDLAAAFRTGATIFAGLGILMLNGYGAISQLFDAEMTNARSTHLALLIGAIIGVVAVWIITTDWVAAKPDLSANMVVGGGLVILWLITTIGLSAAHLVTTDADAAFRAGHAAATIAWGTVAVIALLKARTLIGQNRIVVLCTGLAVMTAAIGKLFLFDLGALDGIYRVIAFIVVGLMLLGLGVAYAQTLATTNDAGTEQPQPVAAS